MCCRVRSSASTLSRQYSPPALPTPRVHPLTTGVVLRRSPRLSATSLSDSPSMSVVLTSRIPRVECLIQQALDSPIR